MKTTENVKISISLLILNDLRHTRVITDDEYNKAAKKLRETDLRLLVPETAKKDIA